MKKFIRDGKHIRDVQQNSQAVGATFSGDTVAMQAGRDINVAGSNIVGRHDVALAAANNINVATAQHTSSQSYQKKEKNSGMMSGGGVGVTLGSKAQSDSYQDSSTMHQGSLIGSLAGSLTLSAGKDVSVRGSDLVAQQDINLVGRNIDISHVQNEQTHAEQHAVKQSGLTLSLSSPTINSATSVAHSTQRASAVDDPRLKKLHAAQAASTALGNAGDMRREAQQLAAGDAGSVSVNLSVGSSQSQSSSASRLSHAQGSQVAASGNLNLIATGDKSDARQGNLTITGSQLGANNVTLAAANDILIQSAQHTSSNQAHNTSSGWNAGVGLSLGQQTGVTFSASGHQARGSGNGNSTTQRDSQINANKQLTIVSGRDTTLQGAQANANKIVADIGRNLSVTSRQESEQYNGQQQSISGGASFTYGSGGGSASFSASQSKTKADYASVNQQSGLNAGSGGFYIQVGNHTQLNGGIIGSTANNNHLSTGSLGITDITNHKQVDSQANSIAGGTGSALYEGAKSALGALAAAHADQQGSDSSQTKATIGQGHVEIRNGDTAALDAINRDEANAHRTPVPPTPLYGVAHPVH